MLTSLQFFIGESPTVQAFLLNNYENHWVLSIIACAYIATCTMCFWCTCSCVNSAHGFCDIRWYLVH